MNYKMNEFIPVVAKLTEKYTAGQSTSVTYERARHLMEAVIYCVEEYEESEKNSVEYEGNQWSENMLIRQVKEKIPAQEAYDLGYQIILEKAEKVKTKYHEMISDFQAYGNKNYYETVTRAIPGFFLYYDARFAPQETIITMDYPTIIPVFGVQGIDAIERYVTYISLEQKFLLRLPEVYIKRTLKTFCHDYEEHFFNICSVIVRDLLLCIMMKKKPGEDATQIQHENCCKWIQSQSKKELEAYLDQMLCQMINERYENDRELFSYLRADMGDFSVWLREFMR